MVTAIENALCGGLASPINGAGGARVRCQGIKGRQLRGAIQIEEPQVQPVLVACGLRMPPDWALSLGRSRVTITGAQFSVQ